MFGTIVFIGTNILLTILTSGLWLGILLIIWFFKKLFK